MCGRLDIQTTKISIPVSEIIGIEFTPVENRDLRPTQQVSTITSLKGRIQQLNTSWGIKPSWSKKFLINAQAETVSEKPTFRKAFAGHRCIVPCSGWYEWSSKDGNKKQKYLFSLENEKPAFMAGIWYPSFDDNLPQLVTLTTSPTDTCKQYHHRMPLLIPEQSINDWLTMPLSEIPILLSNTSEFIRVCTTN